MLFSSNEYARPDFEGLITSLRNLRELGALTKDDFLADSRSYRSAARQLQIAIEACLDVGRHIISRRALRRTKDYKDIFLILKEKRSPLMRGCC